MRKANLGLLVISISLALIGAGCITTPAPLYEVTPTLVTPKGIRIDPTGNEVDPGAVDCIVDQVEKCLIDTFGNPPVLPEEVITASKCGYSTFPLPIDRERLILKIPREIPTKKVGEDLIPESREGLGWFLSCDGSQQILTLVADNAGCLLKGMTSQKEECPCSWRGQRLDSDTIVVPPSLYLLPDWLIRFAVGCQNPWASPKLAACATPLTGPLDRKARCP